VFPVGPGSREITSPAFVTALIVVLRARHSQVDIVLGEGVAAGCDPLENFRVSGYARLADELNVPLIDLNTAERTTVPWKFGKLELPWIVVDRTYINLPILKASSACIVSGALKNQKGLVLPATKKKFHCLGLHEQIAELNAAVQPALTIMDCSSFFDRNMLISGNNCGEVDATACQLLGIDEPDHIRMSRSAGVFSGGYSVRGDEINTKLKAAPPVSSEFKCIGRLRLWSNPRACSMCRYLFEEIQGEFLKRKNLTGKGKLLFHALEGAEIIMGSNPHWRKSYQTVICVGNCTRRVAKEEGFIHIPGCPPSPDDFFDHLP